MDQGNTKQRPVLVVRLPVERLNSQELAAVRAYILECIQTGVLVLPEKVGIKVENLPMSQAVAVETAGAVIAEQTPVLRAHDAGPEQAGEEKRLILHRLKEYRAAHGLGSLGGLVRYVRTTRDRPPITAETLQRLLTGDAVLEIADWRRIGRALDKVEGGQRE